MLDHEAQMRWKTDTLVHLFDQTIERGQSVVIENAEYLRAFGYENASATVKELWRHIIQKMIRSGNTALEKWRREIDIILEEGCLSERILHALGKDTSRENIANVYKHLCDCLEQNKMFLV